MEALIILFMIAAIVAFVLFAIEPPSPQQRTTEVKRKIESEKDRAKADIDAVTEAHKQQVFNLVAAANRQMVEEQAKQARRHAREAVAQAAKE